MRELKDLVDFSGLKIKLASPAVIKSWSWGEVTKPETINYRTLKPEKSGLFSESIFGPTKDWECYCGKYKRIRYRGIVCDKCGVEVTQSKVRRERMGHIALAYPVAHIWFFKKAPSKLSLLLNLPPKDLEMVIYFAQYLITEVDEKMRKSVLKSLVERFKKRKQELKVSFERKRRELKKEEKKEKKAIDEKIKNKERRMLALKEADLKYKQKLQNARDELILEQDKVEEIQKAVSDKVRALRKLALLSEDEYLNLAEYQATGFFKSGMGAEVLLEVIKTLDLEELMMSLRKEIQETKGARYVKATKRLRVVEGIRRAEIDPAWMILRILPVLPPDLRPMVQLSGGRFATSDLNDLYRRVINRNNRLKHLIEIGAPEIILRNEKRMLQEAVDSLIDASKGLKRRRLRRQRQPLRSLSDMLKGKQGRFRQNLLGKRVDYSGRSVIVVGPELKLNQCGLPKEMALEMFKPFVLRELILSGVAPNVKSAKIILEKRPPEVFDVLDKVTRDHPVLLNRAPTLHKLGIQAFFPLLIEGSAIQIHPCICSGFNADFDGDQMAVHIPLGEKAKEESIKLMSPENNLLKPADGSPITIPNKEMVLGCYFVTSLNQELPLYPSIFFGSEEAILAFKSGRIDLRQRIKIKVAGKILETSVGRVIFNQILPKELDFLNEELRKKGMRDLVIKAFRLCPREAVVKLIDDLKDIGFWGATVSGLSVGVWDCLTTDEKESIINQANEKVAEIESNFNRGLVTDQERKRLIQDVWMETTESLAELTWQRFGSENSVKIIINSGGTRASRDQIKQLSAMRGLVLDPLGNIVELPTKSNFREGLSVFEYVTSARGSRKGLTDTAIKTSDAGYLTRRLVDVAHEVIIREKDCKTERGIRIGKDGRGTPLGARIFGRVLAEDVLDEKKEKLFAKGEVIDEEKIGILKEKGISEVVVRSPLTCQARYGLCATCYGWDLSVRKMVDLGSPVGVIAAQSIGEPGTQLTLRTKHFGGIVVSDVTQGLPRVEEIFEIRTPKVLSPLSEIAGKVEVIETEEGIKVRVKTVGVKPVEEREYFIPPLSTLRVEDGQLIDIGTQLASGSLDVRGILEVKGLQEAQKYLIKEVQAVYESQGIPIDDRHFEVIVRKMSDKVQIETAGNTDFLPGELVSQLSFEEENERILAQGGEPASARVIVLGITRSALYTDSWLSAASFEETTNVLTDAASLGREDKLVGLKENVIIGRLIPVTAKRARIKN
ncbi:MAG: DNA-directed RNA polymerase subunit beta' [Candidatus Pacebacteria bacterium]|nr:DNA-directed RNA polymerase subunit beta' [Candidatus Paceibacterota bacterium]